MLNWAIAIAQGTDLVLERKTWYLNNKKYFIHPQRELNVASPFQLQKSNGLTKLRGRESHDARRFCKLSTKHNAPHHNSNRLQLICNIVYSCGCWVFFIASNFLVSCIDLTYFWNIFPCWFRWCFARRISTGASGAF